jgi:hypothetical protein
MLGLKSIGLIALIVGCLLFGLSKETPDKPGYLP